jgi:hypothetical protein
MKSRTRSNRKSLNKTLKGGGKCDLYIKEKLEAINKSREYLNQFYRSWLPADAYNEDGENLDACGDLVVSKINNAFHFLNVAEDKYVQKCKQTGGWNEDPFVKIEKKRQAEEAAARAAQVFEGRKNRFKTLLKSHNKLLQRARDTLNNSINKDDECFKTCKLDKAIKALEDAIGVIDDAMYLIVTSICNE